MSAFDLLDWDDYDIGEAFAYAGSADYVDREHSWETVRGFRPEEVSEVLYEYEGEPDGPEWLGVFRLKNGQYAALAAGCDYTGWDCQAGGRAAVADDIDMLIRWWMDKYEREQMGIA